MLSKLTGTMLLIVMLVPWAVAQDEATDCSDVVRYLKPCFPYLTNEGQLGECCSGVKGLYEAANTPADRQRVCSCLKSLYGSYSKVDLDKASELPGQCGLSIPYKISLSTDCSMVH